MVEAGAVAPSMASPLPRFLKGLDVKNTFGAQVVQAEYQ